MNPAHTPSSQPSTETASQLPPEAVALAGRLFEAARNGGEEAELLLRLAVERGGTRLANLTNDKGDSLVGVFCVSFLFFSLFDVFDFEFCEWIRGKWKYSG
jgi:hypothetical protein